jgi:hypothetical protein
MNKDLVLETISCIATLKEYSLNDRIELINELLNMLLRDKT